MKALQLLEGSRVLRRMVYAAMAVAVLVGAGPFLAGLAKLIEVVK